METKTNLTWLLIHDAQQDSVQTQTERKIGHGIRALFLRLLIEETFDHGGHKSGRHVASGISGHTTRG